MTNCTIIGIDCSTNTKKVALARGHWNGGQLSVSQVECGTRPPVEVITEWLTDVPRALIAIDAPLGWPADMGPALSAHSAGQPISVAPNQLFRRETDRFIKRMINKQPLDVGADRIARTAVAAVNLLAAARTVTERTIPLAWSPGFIETAAIEVYPAATLEARGIASTGYKKPTDLERRREILAALAGDVRVDSDHDAVTATDDMLDSVICCLAGKDFLDGKALAPPDDEFELIKREGWIWVRA